MVGKIIVAIALVAVALILFAGVGTMWIGGDTGRAWSNRLMRYRVLAQFVAIIILFLALWLSGNGH